MGFFNELVSEFTHQGQSQHNSQQQSSHGPPPVSPPWFAEWDSRDNRWLFVNQQTGERTFNYPGPGYGQQQGNSGYGGGGYQGEQHEQKQGSNAWKYAAGGVAGLAGGALLMHEGEEMKEGWDRDKYRVENDIENAPENMANWTGQEVGRAENFGDRVENNWDNAVNDVEDFPEDAARWTGEKVQEVEDIPQDIENKWDNAVGDVEQFGDRMDNAYDDGRDEQRYDDNRNDDW